MGGEMGAMAVGVSHTDPAPGGWGAHYTLRSGGGGGSRTGRREAGKHAVGTQGRAMGTASPWGDSDKVTPAPTWARPWAPLGTRALAASILNPAGGTVRTGFFWSETCAHQ